MWLWPLCYCPKDILFQSSAKQCQLHFSAFDGLMGDLEIRRGENTPEVGSVHSSNYLFVSGDIVAVNPGTDNGIPSGDKWWFSRSTKHMNQVQTDLDAMNLDVGSLNRKNSRVMSLNQESIFHCFQTL